MPRYIARKFKQRHLLLDALRSASASNAHTEKDGTIPKQNQFDRPCTHVYIFRRKAVAPELKVLRLNSRRRWLLRRLPARHNIRSRRGVGNFGLVGNLPARRIRYIDTRVIQQ